MSLLTAGNEIVALGGSCGRCGLQLAVGNALDILGTDPGTALNARGLPMGQIALFNFDTRRLCPCKVRASKLTNRPTTAAKHRTAHNE